MHTLVTEMQEPIAPGNHRDGRAAAATPHRPPPPGGGPARPGRRGASHPGCRAPDGRHRPPGSGVGVVAGLVGGPEALLLRLSGHDNFSLPRGPPLLALVPSIA